MPRGKGAKNEALRGEQAQGKGERGRGSGSGWVGVMFVVKKDRIYHYHHPVGILFYQDNTSLKRV